MNLEDFETQIENSVNGFLEYLKKEEPNFKQGDEDFIDITLHEGKFLLTLDRPDYDFEYTREHIVTDTSVTKLFVGSEKSKR